MSPAAPQNSHLVRNLVRVLFRFWVRSNAKRREVAAHECFRLAGPTGLGPATSGVTGGRTTAANRYTPHRPRDPRAVHASALAITIDECHIDREPAAVEVDVGYIDREIGRSQYQCALHRSRDPHAVNARTFATTIDECHIDREPAAIEIDAACIDRETPALYTREHSPSPSMNATSIVSPLLPKSMWDCIVREAG